MLTCQIIIPYRLVYSAQEKQQVNWELFRVINLNLSDLLCGANLCHSLPDVVLLALLTYLSSMDQGAIY